MIQFTVTQDQLEFFQKWLKDPVVIITVFTWIGRLYKMSKKYFSELIDEKFTMIENNIKSYVDKRFNEHETNAFQR
ncbi:MAG: hypothetical protein KGI50_07940, partial [Patescibacteria group bacterium]|nr:hypothetical protein [Patescibacteria group bacterium]